MIATRTTWPANSKKFTIYLLTFKERSLLSTKGTDYSVKTRQQHQANRTRGRTKTRTTQWAWDGHEKPSGGPAHDQRRSNHVNSGKDWTQEIQSGEQNWSEAEFRGFLLAFRCRYWGNMINQSEQSSKNETETTRLKAQQNHSPTSLGRHESMGGHQRRLVAKTKYSGEVCKSNARQISGAYHICNCPNWHSNLINWLGFSSLFMNYGLPTCGPISGYLYKKL